MNTIINLYQRLNEVTDFRKKYPEYQPGDGKIHILFLSPCLNETGYYRMIAPALELNRTESHSAILGHIHKWDFSKGFDDYDSPIDLRLVEWADYVVLPAIFTDAGYIIRSLRDINNDIEFVMDIDMNYHELPDYHPEKRKMTEQALNNLVSNLSQVDVLTAPNSLLLNYYHDLVQRSSKEFLLHFEIYPNLLSSFGMETIKDIKKNGRDLLRIGIITDPSQVEDLRSIEPAIVEFQMNQPGAVEFIVFGLPSKLAEQHGLFKDLQVSYEKPSPITEHVSKLNELAVDIGLIPMVGNSYNASSGKAIIKYLNYASLMIPVIATGITPFKHLIRAGESGFTADTTAEWLEHLNFLKQNPEQRTAIGTEGFKTAWEHLSYTQATIRRLKSVFI